MDFGRKPTSLGARFPVSQGSSRPKIERLPSQQTDTELPENKIPGLVAIVHKQITGKGNKINNKIAMIIILVQLIN